MNECIKSMRVKIFQLNSQYYGEQLCLIKNNPKQNKRDKYSEKYSSKF